MYSVNEVAPQSGASGIKSARLFLNTKLKEKNLNKTSEFKIV